jgi:hypothetical protein
MLGSLHSPQSCCRTTLHRCRRLSRRRCFIGSRVRAGGDYYLCDSPTDADRAGPRRNRRRARIRCSVRRRRLRAAAGARALLRDLHEPQPSVRGSDRRRRAAGKIGTPRLDRRLCDRDGQCLCRTHGSIADCSQRANQGLGAHRSWATTTASCCSPAPNLFSGAAAGRPSGGLLVTLGDRCGVGSFSWSR